METYKLPKYKANLKIKNGNEVWSYTTKVAIINSDEIIELGYWSVTTRKHVNYVGQIENKPVNHFV